MSHVSTEVQKSARGRRPRAARFAAGLFALLLLVLGGAASAAALAQAADDGYFMTSPSPFSTPTAAFKTDEIDVGQTTATAADPDPDIGELARVRVTITSENPAAIFIGIGPKAQVEAYLAATAHDEFVQATLDPVNAQFRRTTGTATPAPPAAQTFWVAQATGTGTATLDWDKTHGAWSLVVMRADAGPGLAVTAAIGLRFGFLPWIAGGTLLATLLLAGYAFYPKRRVPA